MLTASTTQSILDELKHSPDKNLGQNFLIDTNIVRKSIELAQLERDEVVVEVGPGLGTLTQTLLQQGCFVYAVEKDNRLFERLQSIQTNEKLERLHLTSGDAMDFPLAGLPDNTRNFKIVANLPYAITTPWIEKILQGPLPEKMVLMVQKEAADRLTAPVNTKHYSAISILLSGCYNRVKGHTVAKTCFLPAPKIDSVLLVLEKKEEVYCFHQCTKDVIRHIFTQRRKQIAGIVKKMDREDNNLIEWLNKLPNQQYRPEQIEYKYWQTLDTMIRQNKK
jgi:16S rRNA (adenine1518-N6/adenine1519-N6)-dimethyltransferase